MCPLYLLACAEEVLKYYKDTDKGKFKQGYVPPHCEGNGNYAKEPNKGEWIIAFLYWIHQSSFFRQTLYNDLLYINLTGFLRSWGPMKCLPNVHKRNEKNLKRKCLTISQLNINAHKVCSNGPVASSSPPTHIYWVFNTIHERFKWLLCLSLWKPWCIPFGFLKLYGDKIVN